MKLETNKVGSLAFVLNAGSYEGEVIENIPVNDPFEFIYGIGSMMEGFEKNLNGLQKGDKFKFMLKKDEAYGPYMDEMHVELDKSIFVDANGNFLSEEVQIDNYLPMRDEEGNMLNGKVTAITETSVKLDFNHPLADVDLYFQGEVVEVREASEEELSHGHVHGAHDHHHHDHDHGGCGCGSGDCSTDEEEMSGCGCGSGGCC